MVFSGFTTLDWPSSSELSSKIFVEGGGGFSCKYKAQSQHFFFKLLLRTLVA